MGKKKLLQENESLKLQLENSKRAKKRIRRKNI
jgi:hypothetical protein